MFPGHPASDAARRGVAVALAPVAFLALLALLPGCVSRKLFLQSEPSGATVVLDGRVAGTTPYEEEIPAWGTRRLQLLLPGHEPFETDVSLDTPWWDHWPLDMFSAALPWTLRADYRFAFPLHPAAEADLGWDAAERALQRVRAATAETERP